MGETTQLGLAGTILGLAGTIYIYTVLRLVVLRVIK